MDGLSIENSVGRLVKAATSNTRTVNSYDALGRIKTQWQCTPANCGTSWFELGYVYNQAGGITSYTNSQGVTFTQTFDAAGRLTGVTSSWVDAQHPATLATLDAVNGYYPHGAIKKMLLGNGLTETAAYNNRLQPCRINVNSSGTLVDDCNDPQPGGNLQDFSYGFGHGTADNGNVMSWTAVGAAGAQNFSRSYSYDELNRLAAMSGTGGTCTGLSWTYDVWANRTNQTTAPGGGACPEHHPTVLTNNRLSGLNYDAAGNQTSDPATNATYAYDAENRLVSANSTLGSATYVYDASGLRVRKVVAGGATTDYIYDLAGSVIAEKQGSTWTVGYIYANGQLVAQYKDGTTYFVHKDHLGSTRLMTKLDQSVHDSLDYLPFGEQVAGDTGTTHKFTGHERDAESNLDYMKARHFASSLGRFPQPDSFAFSSLGNPQSFNLYAYVLNNPLRYIDPTGHASWDPPMYGGGDSEGKLPAGHGGGVGDPFIGGPSNYGMERYHATVTVETTTYLFSDGTTATVVENISVAITRVDFHASTSASATTTKKPHINMSVSVLHEPQIWENVKIEGMSEPRTGFGAVLEIRFADSSGAPIVGARVSESSKETAITRPGSIPTKNNGTVTDFVGMTAKASEFRGTIAELNTLLTTRSHTITSTQTLTITVGRQSYQTVWTRTLANVGPDGKLNTVFNKHGLNWTITWEPLKPVLQ